VDNQRGIASRGITQRGTDGGTTDDTTRALSPELADAPPGATSKERVSRWLIAYRPQIAEAESIYGVDRRAIAGAIAWEALENAPTYPGWMNFLARPAPNAPGKLHPASVRGARFINELLGSSLADNTVVTEVEKRGLLPRRTFEERLRLLESPLWAIRYVAAIMRGYADVARDAGYPGVNQMPDILATFYVGAKDAGTLNAAEKSLPAKKARGETLMRGDTMGQWVFDNLPYLEDAIGAPPSAPGDYPLRRRGASPV